MAFVVGKKTVKDTADFNDYAYGIILPIAKGPTGYFEQAFTSLEQARANLLNLLLTNKGERVMQPEFGTGLQGLLFEQMTEDLEEKITNTITENVNFWLPYINIELIDIEMSDEMKDSHVANININFTVGSNTSTQELTFTIRG